MSRPAMIYGTTESWPIVAIPEWVTRCRGCRSYLRDWNQSPENGYTVLPDGTEVRWMVCQVEVGCSNPERCNPHNREGEAPRLFVPRETFEQAELRRVKALRKG